MSLPHRSRDALTLTTIAAVARRAEELGFRDLWVTENTLDDGTCVDPVVALTYAAAITQRIGVGASVVVLPIHHPLIVANQWATLDFVSGGRAILAVGLGSARHYRDFQITEATPLFLLGRGGALLAAGRGSPRHYRDFQIPEAQCVRRFREEVELIKAL